MAKSLRSKVKRSYRAKKRADGVYAATEAARLQRLNAKLLALSTNDRESTEEVSGDDGDDEVMPDDVSPPTNLTETMDVDGVPASSSEPKKISTHGPRNSRRELWRMSRGMAARPKARKANRQGGISAKRRAGRPQRRR